VVENLVTNKAPVVLFVLPQTQNPYVYPKTPLYRQL
jgi:hypothetical protein